MPAGSLPYMAPKHFGGRCGGWASSAASFSWGGCRVEMNWRRCAPSYTCRGRWGLICSPLCCRSQPAVSDTRDAVSSLQQVRNDMKENADVLAYVRTYLAIEAASPPRIEAVLSRWGERSSLVDFLVEQGLLSRAKARTVDAIRKGLSRCHAGLGVWSAARPRRPVPGYRARDGPGLARVASGRCPVAAPEPAVVTKPGAAPRPPCQPSSRNRNRPRPRRSRCPAPEPPVAAKPEPPRRDGAAPRAYLDPSQRPTSRLAPACASDATCCRMRLAKAQRRRCFVRSMSCSACRWR